MKALSLWEPWASLMACGAKKIETRSWPTKYRGPLLICAAKRKMDSDSDYAVGAAVGAAYDAGYFRDTPFPRNYGMAVCVVDLFGCVPVEEAMDSEELELTLGNYTPGRFAWLTNNLRAIEPFPVVGRQGLFEVCFELGRIQ